MNPFFLPSYLLDLIIGDPVWLPHPVKIIGYLAEKLEKVFNNKPLLSKIPLGTAGKEKIAGFVFTLLITTVIFVFSLIVLRSGWRISVWLGAGLSIILGWTCISVRDMARHADDVYQALLKSEISQARQKVGKIVGRDVNNLNQEEICRATVESIAESTVDGIIGPLFYLFLGGPVIGPALALFYKTTSTLDSMVGYRNEKYLNFGWASAKLDDILNYLPARLSRFVIPLAAALSGRDGRGSLRLAFNEAGRHPSPNSGIPEAAMAGALSIQLGGVNYYRSQKSVRPFIGEKKKPICPEDIPSALKVMFLSSLLMALLPVVVFFVLKGIFYYSVKVMNFIDII